MKRPEGHRSSSEAEQRTSLQTEFTPGQQFSREHLLQALFTYIQTHELSPDRRVLRPHQFSVLQDLYEFILRGGNRGFVELPTGIGKTVLFGQLLRACRAPTLIVTPTELLVEQWKDSADTFLSDLDVGFFYGRRKAQGKDATITTYKSLITGIKSGDLRPDQFGMIFFDEAHHTTAPELVAFLRENFPDKICFGFTATPSYAEPGKNLSNLFGELVHRMTVREAVANGYLAPFSVLEVETKVDYSGIDVVTQGNLADLNTEKLRRSMDAINKAALKLYLEHFKGQVGGIRCAGIDHAEEVAQQFREAGVSAEAIHSKMSRKKRKAILDSWKTGEIKILTGVRVLPLGLDNPLACIWMDLVETSSPVIAVQGPGRVIRLDPNNPSKHAWVISFVGHDPYRRTVHLKDLIDGAHFMLGQVDESPNAVDEILSLLPGLAQAGVINRDGHIVLPEGAVVGFDSKLVLEVLEVGGQAPRKDFEYLPEFLDEAQIERRINANERDRQRGGKITRQFMRWPLILYTQANQERSDLWREDAPKLKRGKGVGALSLKEKTPYLFEREAIFAYLEEEFARQRDQIPLLPDVLEWVKKDDLQKQLGIVHDRWLRLMISFRRYSHDAQHHNSFRTPEDARATEYVSKAFANMLIDAVIRRRQERASAKKEKE